MNRALVINKTDEIFSVELSDLDNDTLPEGDVTIEIEYSTLNYKDAMVLGGRSGVTRGWPIVPGIDLAGRVLRTHSDHAGAPQPVPGSLITHTAEAT